MQRKKQKEKIAFVTFLYNNWFNRELEYLLKLYSGIKRNLSYDFHFYCIADENNYERIKDHENIVPVKLDLPDPSFDYKNLRKLSIYNPNNPFNNQNFSKIIVLDLDLIIIGSLDQLVSIDNDSFEFLVRSQFKNKKLPDGDIFIINPSKINFIRIWKTIKKEKKKIISSTRGREMRFYIYFYNKLFNNIDFVQNKLPKQIISFKKHIREKGYIPNGSRIVSFHGHPKPHELKDDSVVDKYWIY